MDILCTYFMLKLILIFVLTYNHKIVEYKWEVTYSDDKTQK